MTFALVTPLIGPAAWGATHVVRIENMKFDPATLEVRVGDTVTWQNLDIVPHTVTAAPGAKTKVDSGSIAGQKTFMLKVERPGVTPYFCRFHPLMKATLKVLR